MLRRYFLKSSTVTPILLTRPRMASSAPAKGGVLVSGGHPGDPEYGCGGTIAKFANAGYRVSILYLNRGEKGCGTASVNCGITRTREAEDACRILRAIPLFGKQIDGEAIVDNSAYAAFDDLIASQSPELILTHWPIDNHRDHRAMSMLSYNAWRALKPHCSLYYYEVTDGDDTMMFSPTDYVDITAEEPIKGNACFAHSSQSPDHFYKVQSDVTRFRGSQVGYTHAEAFVRMSSSRAHPLLSS